MVRDNFFDVPLHSVVHCKSRFLNLSLPCVCVCVCAKKITCYHKQSYRHEYLLSNIRNRIDILGTSAHVHIHSPSQYHAPFRLKIFASKSVASTPMVFIYVSAGRLSGLSSVPLIDFRSTLTGESNTTVACLYAGRSRMLPISFLYRLAVRFFVRTAAMLSMP